ANRRKRFVVRGELVDLAVVQHLHGLVAADSEGDGRAPQPSREPAVLHATQADETSPEGANSRWGLTLGVECDESRVRAIVHAADDSASRLRLVGTSRREARATKVDARRGISSPDGGGRLERFPEESPEQPR